MHPSLFIVHHYLLSLGKLLVSPVCVHYVLLINPFLKPCLQPHMHVRTCIYIDYVCKTMNDSSLFPFTHFPPFLPPSLSPSLPPSLSPSLPPSLPHSLAHSLIHFTPSLPQLLIQIDNFLVLFQSCIVVMKACRQHHSEIVSCTTAHNYVEYRVTNTYMGFG